MTMEDFIIGLFCRIDDRRESTQIPTRKGYKKAESVSLTKDQATALKTQPDTPQGRRYSLIMCLLLDHGLRVGEIARLKVSDLDLEAGELHFYRPKVDKLQTHRLTQDTLQAASAYVEHDSPPAGALLRRSRKDGSLGNVGMTERGITKRVHDIRCRQYWATKAARNGTPIDRLQEAGRWSSPAMPLRYIESSKIANHGVKS